MATMADIGALPDEVFTQQNDFGSFTLKIRSGVGIRTEQPNETHDEISMMFKRARNLSLSDAAAMAYEIPKTPPLSGKCLFPGQAAECTHLKKPAECNCTPTCKFEILDASALINLLGSDGCMVPPAKRNEAIEQITNFVTTGATVAWTQIAELIYPHYYQIRRHWLALVPRMNFNKEPKSEVQLLDISSGLAAIGYTSVCDGVDAKVDADSNTSRPTVALAKEILHEIADIKNIDSTCTEALLDCFSSEKSIHGVFTSRMQKAIRAHSTTCAKCPPFLKCDVPTPLVAAASALWLCTLGPQLDPYFQNSPTGLETCARRLAISMMEDGMPSHSLTRSLCCIRELFGIAKVCRSHKGFYPPRRVVKVMALYAYEAASSSILYPWFLEERNIHNQAEEHPLPVLEAAHCLQLINELGGFDSDKQMFEDLCNDLETGMPKLIVCEKAPERVSEFIFLVDHHPIRGLLLSGSATPHQTAANLWSLSGYNPLFRTKAASTPEMLNLFKIAHMEISLSQSIAVATEKKHSSGNAKVTILDKVAPLELCYQVGQIKNKTDSFCISMQGKTLTTTGDKSEFESNTFSAMIGKKKRTVVCNEGVWSIQQDKDFITWPDFIAQQKSLEFDDAGKVLPLLREMTPQEIFLEITQNDSPGGVANDWKVCLTYLYGTYGMRTISMLLKALSAAQGGIITFSLPDTKGTVPAEAHEDDYQVVECLWLLHLIFPVFFSRLRKATSFTLAKGYSTTLRNLLETLFQELFVRDSGIIRLEVKDQRAYRDQQEEKINDLVRVLTLNRCAILGSTFSFGKTKVSVEAAARFPGKLLFVAMNTKVIDAIAADIATVLGIRYTPKICAGGDTFAEAFDQCNVAVTCLDFIKYKVDEVMDSKITYNLIIDEFHLCFNDVKRTSALMALAARAKSTGNVIVAVSATYTDGKKGRREQRGISLAWYSLLTGIDVQDGKADVLVASDFVITGSVPVQRQELWHLVVAPIDTNLADREMLAREQGSKKAFEVVAWKLNEVVVSLCQKHEDKQIVIACQNKSNCKVLQKLLGEEASLVEDEAFKRIVIGSGTAGSHNPFTSTNKLGLYDMMVFFPIPTDIKVIYQMKHRLQRQQTTKVCELVFVALEGCRVETLAKNQVAKMQAYAEFFASHGKLDHPKFSLPATWVQFDKELENDEASGKGKKRQAGSSPCAPKRMKVANNGADKKEGNQVHIFGSRQDKIP